MVHTPVVSFCNLVGTARARKSTTFPTDVTRLSPPFLRREPGDEAKLLPLHLLPLRLLPLHLLPLRLLN